MPPRNAVQENLCRTEGRKTAIKQTAIRLREPAMATGFQSIDLMRTPPNDQNNAVRSRRRTFLFKGEAALLRF
jgi:xanthine dehydrogenase iron-sulfur cluster and FAD-binding subunit A